LDFGFQLTGNGNIRKDGQAECKERDYQHSLSIRS